MQLDHERIRSILEAPHSFYGAGDAPVFNDARLNPLPGDFLATQFTPTMRVLDVGCGNGSTLIEHSNRFQWGVGIDRDPAHLQMAWESQHTRGVTNVDFSLLELLQLGQYYEDESFDMIFSQRGPLGNDVASVRAAVRLLRPNGMIFCEEIGELHHQEVRELFGELPRRHQLMRISEQVRVAMEQNGITIRLAADIVSKRYYPDLYAWLQFQSSIWTWLGLPLPQPDDPRLALFAERNTTTAGQIETTHHVVWVAGVKPIA